MMIIMMPKTKTCIRERLPPWKSELVWIGLNWSSMSGSPTDLKCYQKLWLGTLTNADDALVMRIGLNWFVQDQLPPWITNVRNSWASQILRNQHHCSMGHCHLLLIMIIMIITIIIIIIICFLPVQGWDGPRLCVPMIHPQSQGWKWNSHCSLFFSGGRCVLDIDGRWVGILTKWN